MKGWIAIALAVVAAVTAAIALAVTLADGDAPAAPSRPASLEGRKLEAEINKLEVETRNASGLRGFFSSYGGFITALLAGLAAIGGFGATIWKQIQEQANQRTADREQREREREQRDVESQRRLEERFTAILTELGSDSEAVQAGAAVSLLSFLRPEQAGFHRQIRLATLANLKVHHPGSVNKLLIRVFEQAIRTGEPLEPIELDLSRAALEYVDLSELDLRGVDIGRANLRGANLTNTTLERARGYEAVLERARPCGPKANLKAARLRKARASGALFRDANLSSVHLEEADLTSAQFQGAKLQAAHLEGADLRGASFEQAQLADTYFWNGKSGLEATLDDRALQSITRAFNWEKAHLSTDQRARLDQLSAPKKQ